MKIGTGTGMEMRTDKEANRNRDKPGKANRMIIGTAIGMGKGF